MRTSPHASPFLEAITHLGLNLALILRHQYRQDGIAFFTGDDSTQQLGYMQRPQGYVIAPHVHLPVLREVQFTQEVLFIKSGRVRVDFYSPEQQYLRSSVLEAGDVVLLAQGGHGFEMLEASEIIEVKQGPYAGEHDKQRFAPVSAVELRGTDKPPAAAAATEPGVDL